MDILVVWKYEGLKKTAFQMIIGASKAQQQEADQKYQYPEYEAQVFTVGNVEQFPLKAGEVVDRDYDPFDTGYVRNR